MPILLRRTVPYDGAKDSPGRDRETQSSMAESTKRRRSSSILQVYHEPPEPLEQLSDQSALPNLNANWVNGKGVFFFFPTAPPICSREDAGR